MGIITLTTDFGWQDWFVGTMKGVILGLRPQAQIVDITHHISAGDIFAGAFALAAAFQSFPKGTVHVAVIDPGVGSGRAGLAVKTQNHFFVGPDNGVLSLALARERVVAIHRLENRKLFLKKVSRTFHGRDVFAPVAAYLSKGVPLDEIGPELRDYVRLPFPPPIEQDGRWIGAVVYVDRFGNAITNLTSELPIFDHSQRLHIRVQGRKGTIPLREFYKDQRADKPLAILGSAGFLEIAVSEGNAAKALGLRVGDPVVVERS